MSRIGKGSGIVPPTTNKPQLRQPTTTTLQSTPKRPVTNQASAGISQDQSASARSFQQTEAGTSTTPLVNKLAFTPSDNQDRRQTQIARPSMTTGGLKVPTQTAIRNSMMAKPSSFLAQQPKQIIQSARDLQTQAKPVDVKQKTQVSSFGQNNATRKTQNTLSSAALQKGSSLAQPSAIQTTCKTTRLGMATGAGSRNQMQNTKNNTTMLKTDTTNINASRNARQSVANPITSTTSLLNKQQMMQDRKSEIVSQQQQQQQQFQSGLSKLQQKSTFINKSAQGLQKPTQSSGVTRPNFRSGIGGGQNQTLQMKLDRQQESTSPFKQAESCTQIADQRGNFQQQQQTDLGRTSFQQRVQHRQSLLGSRIGGIGQGSTAALSGSSFQRIAIPERNAGQDQNSNLNTQNTPQQIQAKPLQPKLQINNTASQNFVNGQKSQPQAQDTFQKANQLKSAEPSQPPMTNSFNREETSEPQKALKKPTTSLNPMTNQLRSNQAGNMSLQQRHSKLAEIRQRKAQVHNQNNYDKAKNDVMSSSLQEPVANKEEFAHVDQQLAQIKEQLESSRRRQTQLQFQVEMDPCQVEQTLPSDSRQGKLVHQEVTKRLQTEVVSGDFHNIQAKKSLNSTPPEHPLPNKIPIMTEPDPCPFEQAQLLTDQATEQIDLDILADCEDSEEESPFVKEDISKGIIKDSQLMVRGASQASQDSFQKNMSIGQDMVEPQQEWGDQFLKVQLEEPMHAVDVNNESSEGEANLSMNSNQEETNINNIAQITSQNLNMPNMFNNATDFSKEIPAQMPSVFQDAQQSEKETRQSILQPQQDITPRDWDHSIDNNKRVTASQERPSSRHNKMTQSQIIDRNLQAPMLKNPRSQSFAVHDVSHSIQMRRSMRVQQKFHTPQIGLANNNQQSISQQLQSLNLESKLKNLQESISQLPNKVHRAHSRASKNRDKMSNSLQRYGGSSQIESEESHSPARDFRVNTAQQIQNNIKNSQRLSLPMEDIRRDKSNIEVRDLDPFDSFAHDHDRERQQPEVLITQEDLEDDEMLIEDLQPIDLQFQRSLNVDSLRQMIKEADLEEEEPIEEEKQQYVPDKLKSFRMGNNEHKQLKKASATDVTVKGGQNKTLNQQNLQKSQYSLKNNATTSSRSMINKTDKSSTVKRSAGSLLYTAHHVSNKQHRDVLPNEPPQRSRLETLALPKSRRGPQNPQKNEKLRPSHQFNNQNDGSFKRLQMKNEQISSTNLYSSATHSSKSNRNESTQHKESLYDEKREQRDASSNNRRQSHKQSLAEQMMCDSNLVQQKNKATHQILNNESNLKKNLNRNTSPQVRKRVFNYKGKTAQTMRKQATLIQTKPSPRQTISAPKACKLSKIAIYKDRQPILGLRKRFFTQALHQRHQQYEFFRREERDSEEQPPTDMEFIECPICKRNFEYTVFTEQHNEKNICQRVFVSKRSVFDSQQQRVGHETEQSQVLQGAKLSINFIRRNPLNTNWQKQRNHFYKFVQMHRFRMNNKKIDKMVGPYVYDPENPDARLGLQDLDQANESILMPDLSFVEPSQVGGLEFNYGTNNKQATNNSASPTQNTSVLYTSDVSHSLTDRSELQEAQALDDRVPCDFCGRKFNPDSALKHIPICQRNFNQKNFAVKPAKKMR